MFHRGYFHKFQANIITDCFQVVCVLNDSRCNHYDGFTARRFIFRAAKQATNHRDPVQVRHTSASFARLFGNQSTQKYGLAGLYRDLAGDRFIIDRWIAAG